MVVEGSVKNHKTAHFYDFERSVVENTITICSENSVKKTFKIETSAKSLFLHFLSINANAIIIGHIYVSLPKMC